jgi:hypothetical protein
MARGQFWLAFIVLSLLLVSGLALADHNMRAITGERPPVTLSWRQGAVMINGSSYQAATLEANGRQAWQIWAGRLSVSKLAVFIEPRYRLTCIWVSGRLQATNAAARTVTSSASEWLVGRFNTEVRGLGDRLYQSILARNAVRRSLHNLMQAMQSLI